MFASWLAELISALTPTERTHNTWAERDDRKRAADPKRREGHDAPSGGKTGARNPSRAPGR